MGGKRTGRAVWILRGALATLGLAGVVYAAEQVTAPTPAHDDVTRAITNQRIKEGLPAQPDPDPEHQKTTLTAGQMVELVGRFDAESKTAYDHGETTRIQAYRSRDLIRMACIDDKLTQMKEIINVVAPRLLSFPQLASHDLVMRQHFVVLQQARNRVMELAAEIDACMGDALGVVSFGRIKEESSTTDSVYDPTRPPSPTHDIERPGEASPYR